jgi:hypothetical protein
MPSEKAGTTTTPVYVPYATLISALDALKRDGIPGTGKIDKSLWDSQSGAIQGQLLLAFRFLGLIDEHNKVLPVLGPLVNASPEERKPILKKIIEEKYSSLVSLDLNTITQGQLDEALRAHGIGGSTLIRAVRFFVKACQETGIPISKRVSEKVRTSPSGQVTTRRRRPTNGAGRPQNNGSDNNSIHTPINSWEERLLEKFPSFDPSWSDELKSQWFEGFERLMGAKSE